MVSVPEVGQVGMDQIGMGSAKGDKCCAGLIDCETPVQYGRLREVAWDLRGWPLRAEAPSCRSGERGPGRGRTQRECVEKRRL